MTRKEEIARASKDHHLKLHPNFTFGEYVAFIDGAQWADQHPHWISVENELPPIGGIVLVAIPLGGELRVLPLSIKNERDFEYLSGMTHWMPLPQAPKKGD